MEDLPDLTGISFDFPEVANVSFPIPPQTSMTQEELIQLVLHLNQRVEVLENATSYNNPPKDVSQSYKSHKRKRVSEVSPTSFYNRNLSKNIPHPSITDICKDSLISQGDYFALNSAASILTYIFTHQKQDPSESMFVYTSIFEALRRFSVEHLTEKDVNCIFDWLSNVNDESKTWNQNILDFSNVAGPANSSTQALLTFRVFQNFIIDEDTRRTPVYILGSFLSQIHTICCIDEMIRAKKSRVKSWCFNYLALCAMTGCKLVSDQALGLLDFMVTSPEKMIDRHIFSGGVVRKTMQDAFIHISRGVYLNNISDGPSLEGLLRIIEYLLKLIDMQTGVRRNKPSDWFAFFEQYVNVGPFLDTLKEFRTHRPFKTVILTRKLETLSTIDRVYRRSQKLWQSIGKLTEQDFLKKPVEEVILEKVVSVDGEEVTLMWYGCPTTTVMLKTDIKDAYLMSCIEVFEKGIL
jgi:hypothetical protein